MNGPIVMRGVAHCVSYEVLLFLPFQEVLEFMLIYC